MSTLPPVIPLNVIRKWLPEIFPEGTPNRGYVVRETACKTIFVLLYAGAVEGSGRWLRPNQVTRMTDRQSRIVDEVARDHWTQRTLKPGGAREVGRRWYAVDSREQIRDETLRDGLVAVGAVIERADIPTTSAKPRYALSRAFCQMLVSLLQGPTDAPLVIGRWQMDHLSTTALNRIRLLRHGAVRAASHERVTVVFPNGETRLMHPGPSTVITKAVVEQFASRFLREPGVVFLSESGNKVVARDEELATTIGLRLDYARTLPDVILADAVARAPKVVFVEVVATDGAVTDRRRKELLKAAAQAGYQEKSIYFVSAFLDRHSPAFRKLVSEIAWGTYAWFSSEPDRIVIFGGDGVTELFSLS